METFIVLLTHFTVFSSFIYGVILILRAHRDRSRYYLAAICLMISALFFRHLLPDIAEPLQSLSIKSTIGGSFLAMIFVLYPIEALFSGWLTRCRIFYIASPFLLAVIIYVCSLWAGVRYIPLLCADDIMHHLAEFNVWIRIFFFFITLVYATFIFLIPHICLRMLVAPLWLHYYKYATLVITLLYIWVVVTGNTASSISYMVYINAYLSWFTYFMLFGKEPRKATFIKEDIGKTTPLIKND